MEAELKVVIYLKDGRALVGIQGQGTDPVLETLPDVSGLEAALAAVPGVVARARERWATSPRCPAYVGPPTEPTPAPARAAVSPGRPRPQPAAAAPEGEMQRLM